MNKALRSMREAWQFRAALRRRVVLRNRPAPSETLWRLAPDAAPIASVAELLPAEVHVSTLRVQTLPDFIELSDFVQPSAIAAELVRSVALACAERLASRPARLVA